MENELNKKSYHGKYSDHNDSRGWFVGSFLDTNNPCKTDKVEVQYKEQQAGHICKKHYHAKKLEIILIIDGKAIFTVDNKRIELRNGDYIFINTNCSILGEFVENTRYFTIHAPSFPDDKINLV